MMANFAHIKDNKVVNILVADTLEIAQEVTGATCIEYAEGTSVGAGYTWDGTKFIEPVTE